MIYTMYNTKQQLNILQLSRLSFHRLRSSWLWTVDRVAVNRCIIVSHRYIQLWLTWISTATIICGTCGENLGVSIFSNVVWDTVHMTNLGVWFKKSSAQIELLFFTIKWKRTISILPISILFTYMSMTLVVLTKLIIWPKSLSLIELPVSIMMKHYYDRC